LLCGIRRTPGLNKGSKLAASRDRVGTKWKRIEEAGTTLRGTCLKGERLKGELLKEDKPWQIEE